MQCSACGSSLRDGAGICLACGELVKRRVAAADRLEAATAGVPAWIAFEAHPPERVDYPASRIARILAAITDAVVLAFLGAVLVLSMGGQPVELDRDGTFDVNVSRTIASFAMNAGYFIVFVASAWQGTPGKRLLGLRIVSLDGKRLSFPHSAARWFCQQVCFLVVMPLGMIVALIGVIAVPIAFLVLMGDGRSPWDWMAGTKVVS